MDEKRRRTSEAPKLCEHIWSNGPKCLQFAKNRIVHTFVNWNNDQESETHLFCVYHTTRFLKPKTRDIHDGVKHDVDLVVTPIVVSPDARKPTIVDFIDPGASACTQCCIRLRPNDPLCRKQTAYEIRGKYFCAPHGRRHPHVREAKALLYRLKDRDMVLAEMEDRLKRIEKAVLMMNEQWQYMLGMPEFRAAVYELANRTLPPAAT